jgi:hypothetical protein
MHHVHLVVVANFVSNVGPCAFRLCQFCAECRVEPDDLRVPFGSAPDLLAKSSLELPHAQSGANRRFADSKPTAVVKDPVGSGRGQGATGFAFDLKATFPRADRVQILPLGAVGRC